MVIGLAVEIKRFNKHKAKKAALCAEAKKGGIIIGARKVAVVSDAEKCSYSKES